MMNSIQNAVVLLLKMCRFQCHDKHTGYINFKTAMRICPQRIHPITVSLFNQRGLFAPRKHDLLSSFFPNSVVATANTHSA